MENAANHSPDPGLAQRLSSLPGPRPTDPENLPVNSRTRLIRKAVQPAGIAEVFSHGKTGSLLNLVDLVVFFSAFWNKIKNRKTSGKYKLRNMYKIINVNL